jgi:hypothetical protein
MSASNLQSISKKKKSSSQLFLSTIPNQFIIKEVKATHSVQLLARKHKVKIIDPCNTTYLKNTLNLDKALFSTICGDFKGTIIYYNNSEQNIGHQIPDIFSHTFLENISSTFELLSSHQEFRPAKTDKQRNRRFSALSIEYLVMGSEKIFKCTFLILSELIGG